MKQHRLCATISCHFDGYTIQFETKQIALDNFSSAKSHTTSTVNPAVRFMLRRIYGLSLKQLIQLRYCKTTAIHNLISSEVKSNKRIIFLCRTIPTILVLNLVMTKSLLNERRTNILFIYILRAQMFIGPILDDRLKEKLLTP